MKLSLYYTAFQQRLGFVNAVIVLTSPDSFTYREKLAKLLFQTVESKQDSWLSQYRSSTGRLLLKTAVDIVDFATDTPLELLFPSTFTWRPDARILENLISDDEYDAFEKTHSYNPLYLTLPERIFYLHRFLINDGFALVHIMNRLRPLNTWTRKDAAALLQEIYEQYGKDLKSSAQSSSDYAEAQRILALAELMKLAREGVVGTKELRVTPRLEALVDLHIIDKPGEKRDSFVYCRNNSSDKFVEEFKDKNEKEESINHNFFARCASVYHINGKPAEDGQILQMLINNSKYVRAAYGLAGIDEVCLLTAIRALTNPSATIIELDRARRVLIDQEKQHQNHIKLHVDTKGNIRYFAVSKEFAASITHQ